MPDAHEGKEGKETKPIIPELSVAASRGTYVAACAELGCLPVSRVVRNLGATSISLRHYGIGARGTVALAEGLRVSANVRRLDLSSNNIGVEGGLAVGELLQRTQRIHSVDVSSNKIASGAASIAEALAHHGGLRELILRNNAIDPEAAKVFGRVGLCASKCRLLRLDLAENKLDDGAAVALARGLAENCSLVRLDLSWNRVGHR